MDDKGFALINSPGQLVRGVVSEVVYSQNLRSTDDADDDDADEDGGRMIVGAFVSLSSSVRGFVPALETAANVSSLVLGCHECRRSIVATASSTGGSRRHSGPSRIAAPIRCKAVEGISEGIMDGAVEGINEGPSEGIVDGLVDGSAETANTLAVCPNAIIVTSVADEIMDL